MKKSLLIAFAITTLSFQSQAVMPPHPSQNPKKELSLAAQEFLLQYEGYTIQKTTCTAATKGGYYVKGKRYDEPQKQGDLYYQPKHIAFNYCTLIAPGGGESEELTEVFPCQPGTHQLGMVHDPLASVVVSELNPDGTAGTPLGWTRFLRSDTGSENSFNEEANEIYLKNNDDMKVEMKHSYEPSIQSSIKVTGVAGEDSNQVQSARILDCSSTQKQIPEVPVVSRNGVLMVERDAEGVVIDFYINTTDEGRMSLLARGSSKMVQLVIESANWGHEFKFFGKIMGNKKEGYQMMLTDALYAESEDQAYIQ